MEDPFPNRTDSEWFSTTAIAAYEAVLCPFQPTILRPKEVSVWVAGTWQCHPPRVFRRARPQCFHGTYYRRPLDRPGRCGRPDGCTAPVEVIGSWLVLLVVGPSAEATWEFSMLLSSLRLVAAQRKEKRRREKREKRKEGKRGSRRRPATTRRPKPTTFKKSEEK